MILLTTEATVYIDNGAVKQIYSLYKTASAQNHKSSDDQSLKQALIQALNAPLSAKKTHQGNGVYRFRINDGNGYLVYRRPATPDIANSAAIFHYHWNYAMDMPLNVD